ncbi:MAG: hypothetical protein MI824_24050 [Hyphomicrobiales bacterium]|nr:hypothetical protein [Hyphomicrobiales bacterium]
MLDALPLQHFHKGFFGRHFHNGASFTVERRTFEEMFLDRVGRIGAPQSSRRLRAFPPLRALLGPSPLPHLASSVSSPAHRNTENRAGLARSAAVSFR